MIDLAPWILRHTTIPLWALYERSPYRRIAERLEAEGALPLEVRRQRQLADLRHQLEHASRLPHYRDRFRDAGFEPGDLRSLDDLAHLPMLSKDDLRDTKRFLASEHTPGDLVHKRTSGSTGMPLQVVVDRRCHERRRGVLLYRDRWTGWRPGERRAVLRGVVSEGRGSRHRLRQALVYRISCLDTLKLDEATLHAFALRILRERPTLLFGQAHSMFLLARFWEERALPAYRFRAALSTAMPLVQHERRTIEQVFDTRVFDRYGCEELSLIATECEAHTGLHVNTDALMVEIVPDGAGDAGGRVVVTDLWNRAMPLIRYDVGDRAAASSHTCPCGRTYPLLERVLGRVADHLWTPAGRCVSGIPLTEVMAALAPAIRQVQIVQDRIDHLRLRIVAGDGFGDGTRSALAREVERLFGTEMHHSIELLAEIPREPSGKYRFTVCALPEGERRHLAGPTSALHKTDSMRHHAAP